MLVILDSSVLCADFRQDGTQFQILISSKEKLGLTVCIPEVAIAEVNSKHQERVSKLLEDWKKISQEAQRLLGRSDAPSDPPWHNECQGFKAYFDKLLIDRYRRLPFPNVGHEQVVRSILTKRAPFSSGESGYRDYLIWQTVLAAIEPSQEKIAFITLNSHDFGKSQLKPELQNDLEAIGGSNRVEYFNSLSDFNDRHILAESQNVDALRNRLNDESENRFYIKRWADKFLWDALKDERIDYLFSPFPTYIGHNELILPYTISETSALSVNRLPSDDFLVRAHSKLVCDMDVSVDESDMSSPLVVEHLGRRLDSNASSWWTEKVNGAVEYSIILGKSDLSVKSVQIDKITSNYCTIPIS